MRYWNVAGGLLQSSRGLLLVANERRDGLVDWTTPGGVVDDGETAVTALGREVEEETGLVVGAWRGPRWTVSVTFVDLEMQLDVEVHEAVTWSGSIALDDPDGIVTDADFVAEADLAGRLSGSPRWVSEPLEAWVAERWSAARRFHYRAQGAHHRRLRVVRVEGP